MPDISRDFTWPARKALATAAGGKPSSSWHAADRVLYALLGDLDCDAARTLLACDHDLARLREEVRRTADHFVPKPDTAADTLRPDDADSAVVRAARLEAESAGALSVTTRDLLLAAFQQPAPGAESMQQGKALDLAVLRAWPVQVYELIDEPQPVRPHRKRIRFPISPIFLGLVALTAGTGLYLYLTPAPLPIGVFVFVTAGWIVSLALHEFGHALAAYFGGDHSVVERGYLTLDPLKYTHPLLSIVMPVIFLMMGGIGLPGGAVFINTAALRSRTAYTLVSASGPLANMIFAVVLAVLFSIIGPELWFAHWELSSGLAFLILLQISAILLNLLPIPGLDGFGIVAPWLPDNVLQFLLPLSNFGFFILFFLFWQVEPFQEWFWTQVGATLYQLRVDGEFALAGLQLYQFWQ